MLIGTAGASSLIDALAKRGKLSLSELQGRWESFLITTVDKPLPGIDRALVVIGSDRRGRSPRNCSYRAPRGAWARRR